MKRGPGRPKSAAPKASKRNKSNLSAEAKAKISAAQKKRWAKLKRAKKATKHL